MSAAPEQKATALPAVSEAQLLTAAQVGAEFGVSGKTVLHWHSAGLRTGRAIPDAYIRRRGRDRLFHPAILDLIRAEQCRPSRRAAPAGTP